MNLWERLVRPAHAPMQVRARRALGRLGRDLRAVADGLRGQGAEPLVRRTRRTAPVAATAAAGAREVRVAEVRRETADAITLVLEDVAGAPLRFVPGQFFTLLVDIDGETVRRAYSASSSFTDEARAAITIKRVAGGRVSNHLHDRVRAGDRLRVLGPSGDFTVAPDPAHRRHLVLLGGGSGITPLMAITRAVLVREPDSRITLIVGNRSDADIVFRDELAALAAAHPDALRLRHVLEEPVALAATRGRLDEATVAAQLDALDRVDLPTEYFVCGPAPMMAAARAALLARGVAPAEIREERFASPARPPSSTPSAPQPVTLRRAGQERGVLVPPGTTLLDAGLGAGLAMPFSCAMGGCGACAVDVISGAVEMEEPNCLSADERARGVVLACVARPTGPCTIALRGGSR